MGSKVVVRCSVQLIRLVGLDGKGRETRSDGFLWQSRAVVMKQNLIRIGFMGLALAWGCLRESVGLAAPPPERGPAAKLLARFHYVGAAQLAGNTNGSQLRKIWALPETVRFREEVMKKLAKAPGELFPKHGASGSVDPSAWFRRGSSHTRCVRGYCR